MTDQILDNNGGGSDQRPTFLTVLCILSFVGAGISIILLLLAAAAMGVVEAGLSAVEDAGGTVASGTGSVWTLVIVSIALTLISLFGVIKMWKLQKTGFFIYTGASIGGIVVSVIMNGVGPAMLGIVISLAFIVMYGLNLKAMK